MKRGPYRDGNVHVLADLCATCIFRPGNLMQLNTGRVKDMVTSARKKDSVIICHSTMHEKDVQPAVCRGFHNRYSTNPLRIAQRLGLLVEDPVPQ